MQINQTIFPSLGGVSAELQGIVVCLCNAAQALDAILKKPQQIAQRDVAVRQNSDGDMQVPLDVIADELVFEALRETSVKWYVSEERESVSILQADGKFALAVDPLDGSSNVDINVPVGTIFSIFPAEQEAEPSFLRSSGEQLAAGYFIYGPQLQLMLTLGQGVLQFGYDPVSETFVLMRDSVQIAERSSEFAINMSNYRHWSNPIRAYVDECLAGVNGARERHFNMRWVASLVAEAHRILTRGGVFLYPADQRDGYDKGRLRLLYECAPIGFLIEQAGGRAIDGHTDTLDLAASELHERVPFVFGSRECVDLIRSYHEEPEKELSALFTSRGLFRG